MKTKRSAVCPKRYRDNRKELLAAIDAGLRKGESAKAIAQELGVSPIDLTYLANLTATAARLAKSNLPGGNIFAKARLEMAKPILEEANRIGLQVAEAAGRLGYPEHSVRHWIRRLKITWRNTNGRTVFRYEKANWFPVVEPLVAQGLTNRAIRDRLNETLKAKISEPTVGRFILNNGLRACRGDDTP
jgi:AraC-like DNA-binding protein